MYENFSKIYDEMMEYLEYDEWLLLILNNFSDNVKKILDIGCGTGELSIRLKRLGFSVVGIDLSKGMLDKAKEKDDNIKFIQEDMKNFKLEEEFDAAIMIFDTINHLLNEEELRGTIKNVYNHLSKDGIFIFDTATRKLMNEMFPEDYFVDDREEMTIIWQHEYNNEEDLDYIFTSFFVHKKDNIYERIDEEYAKKIFSEKVIDNICKNEGFEIIKKINNNNTAGDRIFYFLKK
ncbi:methyltransferase family protein [Hypnocyclicus thermotrophus]|uniref:Methyltransferase family protein n=1 Tax=Hypnocyclicus thermotrophus TaxID=1627895 RepID=A0AA46DYP4_9FUSO|nr:class I SAM-dependent methyltransferase [Hypnocyclicus thermotrophus]TDT70543.1 methyltransferase family protein [Hypnocyclicus thermotrophus]